MKNDDAAVRLVDGVGQNIRQPGNEFLVAVGNTPAPSGPECAELARRPVDGARNA